MLTPRQWRLVLYCVGEELRARRAGKAPVQSWNAELIRAVEIEIATSESGSESDCAGEESEPKVPISARQAADIIGCSSRYVRGIARKLGGVKVDGRWVFDEGDVLAHAEGQKHGRLAG